MRKKQKNKKPVIILVAIIFIIIIIAIINRNHNNENTEKKNQVNLVSTTTIRTSRNELDYYIKNIVLQKKGKQTIFKIDVENQNPYTLEAKWVNVIFMDRNGMKQEEAALYIREIEPGETISTQVTIHSEIKDVSNFKMEERQQENK